MRLTPATYVIVRRLQVSVLTLRNDLVHGNKCRAFALFSERFALVARLRHHMCIVEKC